MSKNNQKKKRDITDAPDNMIREEDIEDLDAEDAGEEPDRTDDRSPEASQGEAVSVSDDKTEGEEHKEGSGEKESERSGGSDDDLYSDEVYRESEESEDDIVYLELSGNDTVEINGKNTKASEKEEKGTKEKREKEKKDINISGILIPWLLVILGAFIYISLTFNYNVWLDEAFTASLVNADMPEVIRRSMADTLPPLYNILLKLSTDFFGYSVPVMKMTSAVPMILTMILGATIVRKRYGTLTSCIFILAIIVMPNMFFYGVEIRMYSLGFLFATAAGIFAGETVNSPRFLNWMMLTLSTVLAGYSHHFAFVTAGLTYLFILIYACVESSRYREDEDKEKHPLRLGSFFICLLATVILYFPCLLVTLQQLKSVSGYFSMPEVTLSVFIKYSRYPFTAGFTPLSIILLVLTGLLFIRALVRKNKTVGDLYIIYCFILYYIVLLFGTVISRIMTANIFVDRYLFFALGLIWLFFAREAATLKKWAAYLIVMLEIVIGTNAYNIAYASEYAPGVRELTGWLNQNVSEGDSLYTLEGSEELACCLPFYNGDLVNYETLDDAVNAANEVPGSEVFVAVLDSFEGTEDYDTAIKEIQDKGYGIEYISEFRFDRYMFKMYKLTD
ncbi:MAG TPA: hypothetical protein DIS78_08055 [Lachnospiraceae bacterium]|nr:hypothetical protein [Lachnospiraceae bacterium]